MDLESSKQFEIGGNNYIYLHVYVLFILDDCDEFKDSWTR